MQERMIIEGNAEFVVNAQRQVYGFAKDVIPENLKWNSLNG